MAYDSDVRNHHTCKSHYFGHFLSNLRRLKVLMTCFLFRMAIVKNNWFIVENGLGFHSIRLLVYYLKSPRCCFDIFIPFKLSLQPAHVINQITYTQVPPNPPLRSSTFYPYISVILTMTVYSWVVLKTKLCESCFPSLFLSSTNQVCPLHKCVSNSSLLLTHDVYSTLNEKGMRKEKQVLEKQNLTFTEERRSLKNVNKWNF